MVFKGFIWKPRVWLALAVSSTRYYRVGKFLAMRAPSSAKFRMGIAVLGVVKSYKEMLGVARMRDKRS